jgi:membrane-associated protein
MMEAAGAADPGVLDFLVHFPDYLAETIAQFRGWTYVLMFGILVAETGLIFFGWLPGDTMLFTAGLLSSSGKSLDVRLILPIMSLAAFTGDQINFLMGAAMARRTRRKSGSYGANGSASKSKRRSRAAKRLANAKGAYARHGGKVVIIGRFIPVLSSIAPLGAALSGMPYTRFIRFSAAGCILWTTTFTLTGFFFGKIPLVRDHFWLAIISVVAVSSLSGLAETLWTGRESRRPRSRHGAKTGAGAKKPGGA